MFKIIEIWLGGCRKLTEYEGKGRRQMIVMHIHNKMSMLS